MRYILFQPLDLILSFQKICGLIFVFSAGDRAAGIDDFPVQRDEADSLPASSGHDDRRVEIIHHRDTSQQIFKNLLITIIEFDEIHSHPAISLLPADTRIRMDPLSANGSYRKECQSTGSVHLQCSDSFSGAVVIGNDDILHRRAKRGLDGGFIPAGDLHHFTDHALYSPDSAAHDIFHSRVVAFIVLLHLLDGAQARLLTVVPDSQLLCSATQTPLFLFQLPEAKNLFVVFRSEFLLPRLCTAQALARLLQYFPFLCGFFLQFLILVRDLTRSGFQCTLIAFIAFRLTALRSGLTVQ